MNISFNKKLSLLFLLLSFQLFSQTTVFLNYNNGKWESILSNPFSFEISNSLKNQNVLINKNYLGKTLSSAKFNLLLQKDSADAFTPGLYCYATNTGWAAMDDGNGKKYIVMAFLDTSRGINSTVYYSSNNFQPVLTSIDTGFIRTNIFTETANVQMTASQSPEHIIHYGSNSGFPKNKIQMKINSGFNGSTLFTCQTSDRINTFFIPSGFLNENKPNFDLNNNGMFEIIGIGKYDNGTFFGGQRLFIYDNFTLIDSIDDERSSLLNNAFTTCNDLNADGKPEIVISINGYPRFFQWNNSLNKFQILDSLDYTKKLWIEPENVDQDNSMEIIANGGYSQDSMIVYNSQFDVKYKIKHPSIPSATTFFVANINNSPAKEIIFSSQYFGTAVYDLSTGTDPIWFNKNFETIAVADFRNTGHSDLLGIYRKDVAINHLMMVDGTNNFQPIWTRIDSTSSEYFSYQRFIGPHNPQKSTNLIFMFSSYNISNAQEIDFDQDGKNDFIVEAYNKKDANKSLYLIINSNGDIVDSLKEIELASLYAFSHDFNNNGAPEIVITGFNIAKNTSYIYEYKYPSLVTDNSIKASQFILEQNYPNPFNSKSKIAFFVPETRIVSLKLYNILGQELETLIDHQKINGRYEFEFDAKNLSSGTYFYQAITENQILTKKMILIK